MDIADNTARHAPAPAPLSAIEYWRCFGGIVWREELRFLHQRGRFVAALIRPLVWLFVFAAGFRSVFGISIIEPYETYVLYEVYITPGLIGMIQLFSGMQSSLSMVYDREMGAMRSLLVSPFPRWFLLGSKLVASMLVSLVQVYVFLAIAWFWAIEPPLPSCCLQASRVDRHRSRLVRPGLDTGRLIQPKHGSRYRGLRAVADRRRSRAPEHRVQSWMSCPTANVHRCEIRGPT